MPENGNGWTGQWYFSAPGLGKNSHVERECSPGACVKLHPMMKAARQKRSVHSHIRQMQFVRKPMDTITAKAWRNSQLKFWYESENCGLRFIT